MPPPAPQDIKGVFTAALTFVDAELSPDPAACVDHCAWLLDNGCDGIGLLGTTGEAPSFSVAQRRGLLDAVLGGGISPHRLIVGTGAAALADAAELTAHAASLGVAGCLVVPPFYFKGVSDDGLYASYAALIERVGRDDLRLFLYHFPQMSAVPIPHTAIARLIEDFPGVITGIKDSSGDLDSMLGFIGAFPGLRIFSGTERFLLPVLEAGGAGCITAGGNVTSSAIGRLYAHWRECGGDKRAEDLQAEVTALRDVLEGAPMIAAMKALIARHRGESGLARVAPPLSPLAEADAEAFVARVGAAGLTLP
ncbi:MAG: dihydrodipicolinate synthase family protein [Alphaproteobacteria bacterium]|nr:dihydrodipicolinate synthase family protein [Alphaproteobacteria bacterium]